MSSSWPIAMEGLAWMTDPLMSVDSIASNCPPVKSSPRMFLWFPRLHFKAVLFRRWILIKRSMRMVIATLLMTFFFAFLAVGAHWLMTRLIHEFTFEMNFKFLTDHSNSEVLIAADDDSKEHLPWVEMLSLVYQQDMNETP
jgi:hypothetical protein